MIFANYSFEDNDYLIYRFITDEEVYIVGRVRLYTEVLGLMRLLQVPEDRWALTVSSCMDKAK